MSDNIIQFPQPLHALYVVNGDGSFTWVAEGNEREMSRRAVDLAVEDFITAVKQL